MIPLKLVANFIGLASGQSHVIFFCFYLISFLVFVLISSASLMTYECLSLLFKSLFLSDLFDLFVQSMACYFIL
jgi:hypothetical protein